MLYSGSFYLVWFGLVVFVDSWHNSLFLRPRGDIRFCNLARWLGSLGSVHSIYLNGLKLAVNF